ncbi:MAG: hypothetical protein DI537_13930 [Stutzerimonas stutzeri]|nr:MAG: hypothetical protein DI537_13930 [Stutzerimonas stutzeri]
MSISATYFIDRNITRAAKVCDLLLAAGYNKVPREAAKLRALKDLIETNQARLKELAAACPGISEGDFVSAALARMKELRQAQFAEVKRKRDLRAAYEAERKALLDTGVIPA